MKSIPIKVILFNGLLCLLLITGCGKSTEQTQTLPVEVEAPAVEQPVANTSQEYYINTINNESLAQIAFQKKQFVITTSAGQLFGVLKKEDKRKYYDQNDRMRYAIKYSEGGFKLRDENEELLWKIKVDDKIKIADNEEMENAYKISRTDESKIKLKKDEEEIAAIRVSNSSSFVNINDQYNVHNFGQSLALGIMLMEEISDEQKFIICTELLKFQQ